MKYSRPMVLFAGMMFLALSFGFVLDIEESADALTITGLFDITTDRVYYENLVVSSTGHLRIHAGVNVQMDSGYQILVEGGKLSFLGNRTHYATVTSTPGNYWGGIEADHDSTVYLNHARIRFATVGLQCTGTGYASGGSLTVNNSYFSVCDIGMEIDGDGRSEPFSVEIKDNLIFNSETGMSLIGGLNNITVENNMVENSREYGISLSGCDGVEILNNTVWDARYGMGVVGSVNWPILVRNNTIEDCSIGLVSAFIKDLEIKENHIKAMEKGIYMGLCYDITIEDNNIAVMGPSAYSALEIEPSQPFTIIRNNIITSTAELLILNGSQPFFTVYDNLLTNLTASQYIDSDGDGYTDSGTFAAGTGGIPVVACRTCIFPETGSSPTYVNPKQAARYAASGTNWDLIHPTGYGPRNTYFNQIYFVEAPIFASDVDIRSSHMEDTVLWTPGEQIWFNSASGAGLKGFSVMEAAMGAMVQMSDNITLEDLRVFLPDPGRDGIHISESEYVALEKVYVNNVHDRALIIGKSTNVDIIDSSFYGRYDDTVVITDSDHINGIRSNISSPYDIGIFARNSMLAWRDSRIMSGHWSVHMVNCYDSVLSNISPNTQNTVDRMYVLEDSRRVRIDNTRFEMHWKNVDVTAIEPRGNCQEMVVENCIFSGIDKEGLIASRGLSTIGNISGSVIRGNHFFSMYSGISASTMLGDVTLHDLLIEDTVFTDVQTGLFVMMYGDPELVNCSFNRADTGIRAFTNQLDVSECSFSGYDLGLYSSGKLSVSSSAFNQGKLAIQQSGTAGSEPVALDDIRITNTHEGVNIRNSPLTVRDCSIFASGHSLNLTDTDGSNIYGGSLTGIPVAALVDSSSSNVVSLHNTHGDPAASMVGGPTCQVDWYYPLHVSLVNEIDEPIEGDLLVTSDLLGELYNGPISGTHTISDLLGFSIDSEGVHNYTEHSVEATIDLQSDTEEIILDREIWVDLFIDLPPEFTGPSNISIYEDKIFEVNMTGWFFDRNPVSFNVKTDDPVNVSAILVNDTWLRIILAENWTGWVNLNASADDGNMMEEYEIRIDIHNLNDPPCLDKQLPLIEISEDSSGYINLSGYGYDGDHDELSWSTGPLDNCTVSWDGMNLTITPDPDWNGILTIPLILSDGTAEVHHNLSVNVTPVNDPPFWDGPIYNELKFDAGAPFSYTIPTPYGDIDGPNLDFTLSSDSVSFDNGTLIFDYPELPSGDTNEMNANITLTISDGEFSIDIYYNITVTYGPGEGDIKIDDERVTIDDETGDWTVEVEGEPGQDIYIVIEGVGSFKLEETSDGNYSVTIPGSEFEEGEEYSYHFSNRAGGIDGTGGEFGGTLEQPEIVDDDQDDDDGISPWVFILIGALILLFIIGAFAVASRRGSSSDLEGTQDDDEDLEE